MKIESTFDEVEFKAASAVFRLAWSEYNKAFKAKKNSIPKGWCVSSEDSEIILNPHKIRNAVRLLDICLGIHNSIEDPNRLTAMNLKAMALRDIGEYEVACKVYNQVLLDARESGNKPYAQAAEDGIGFCKARQEIVVRQIDVVPCCRIDSVG